MRASQFLTAIGLAALMTGLSGTAHSADYLRGTQIEQAPPTIYGQSTNSDAIDWSGLYIGAHGGMTRTHLTPGSNLQTLATSAYVPALGGSALQAGNWFSQRAGYTSGQSYGIIAGYTMSFEDALIGLEGDWTHSSKEYKTLAATGVPGFPGVALTGQETLKLTDYGSARLRFGWAYGRFAPFATLGLAMGRVDTAWSLNQSAPGAGPQPGASASCAPLGYCSAKSSFTAWGFSGGVGADIALTSNVFLRAEYLYTRLTDGKRSSASLNGTVMEINTARAAVGVKF